MLSDAIQDHPTETFTILFIAAVMIQNVIIHWAVDKRLTAAENELRAKMRHVAETHIQLITDTMVQEVRPQLIERIERLEVLATANAQRQWRAAAESKATAAKAAKTPAQQSDLGGAEPWMITASGRIFSTRYNPFPTG